MGVDEYREHCRQVVFRAIALADRHPFTGGGFGLFDIGRHGLPLARIFVEDDVAFRVHAKTTFAMHSIGLLDTADVLGGRQQPDHVGAAQDQRLAVAPAFDDSPSL
jgi:hypothetical protein